MQSYPARVRELAARHPDRTAVVACASDGTEETLTWGELVDRSSRAARRLAERGAGAGRWVVVGLPNSVAHVVACSAAWMLGASVLALNPRAPRPERDAHLALLPDPTVVATWPDVPGATDLEDAGACEPLPCQDVTAEPGVAIGTGGSTGRPKLVLSEGPWGHDPELVELFAAFGWGRDETVLVPGPLHHSFGFDWCYLALLSGHTVVLLERFDAVRAVDAVERHGVTHVGLVPTMMRRVAALPGIGDRDLTSLRTILHTAGPCPASVKEAWIDLLGPAAVIEAYGSSEGYGNTVIRGDEWLAHRGSVGRPLHCEVTVRDSDGRTLPPGVVGEVYLRRSGRAPRYLGAPAPSLTADGFGTAGDLGWLDEDGYLYLADRRVDLVITGGANVYPAEVEGVLLEHRAVGDAAVIGLPDADLGKRVHALVQPEPGASLDAAELDSFCRARLASYKVPRTFELVDLLPRDNGGKLRRSALVTERTP